MVPVELLHIVCTLAVLRSCKHVQLVQVADYEDTSSVWAEQRSSLRLLQACNRGTSFARPLRLVPNITFSIGMYPDLKKWQFTDTMFLADLRPQGSVRVLNQQRKVWEGMSRLPWLLISDAESYQQVLQGLSWMPDNRVILLRLGGKIAKFYEAYQNDATAPPAVTEIGAVNTTSLELQKGSELAKDPWDRRRNLTGFLLRCSGIPYRTISILTPSGDGTVRVTGFSGDVLDALQSSLNFNLKCHLPSQVIAGASSTGAYTGILGDLYNNRADIAIPFFYRFSEREDDFDFTYTISNEWHALAVRRPKKFQGTTNYTREFDWTAWVATFGLFFVCLGILMVIVKFCGDRDNISWSICVFSSVKLFCNMGQEKDIAHSVSYRLWLLTVLVSVMVLHVSYSSSLVTLLTTYKLVLPFEDLHGLYRVRDQFTLGIDKGTTMEELMKTDTKGILGAVYRDIVLKRPEFISNVDFSYQHMLKDRSHTMFYPVILPLEDCRILLLKPRYFEFPVAFPARRGLSVLPILNSQLKKMHSGGLIKRLMRKFGLKVQSRSCPGLPATALGLEETYTALCLLAFGIALSVIFLAVECALSRVGNRERKSNDFTATRAIMG